MAGSVRAAAARGIARVLQGGSLNDFLPAILAGISEPADKALAQELVYGSLHDRLALLGADAVVEALARLDSLRPRKQDNAAATYAHKLNKEEARIDWQRPAAELARLVRAFNPWPVAFFEWEGRNVRAWDAQPLPGQVENAPGEVLHVAVNGIDVATGDGILRLVRLQPPGKRPMTAGEFLNGHPIRIGEGFD